MKALVLGIVWAFACSCCIAADIPIQPGFDARKMAGKWYPIQIVIDKGAIKDVKILGRGVDLAGDGDLTVYVTGVENGECFQKVITFFHTDQPGKFTTEAGSTIRIVETDYKTYQIVHVETKLQNILQLEATDPEASGSINEKFKEVAGSLGFPTDKIIDNPSTAENAKPCMASK